MERAERQGAVEAPPPRYEPSQAGMAGGFICSIAITVFAAAAGLGVKCKVERRRTQLEESVARYLAQLDTADRQEPTKALAVCN